MVDSRKRPGSKTRDKFRRLLVRSVPATIPWVGNLWKDIVDEFSDDEVEQALGRLENFSQADADAQRELLVEVLKLREIAGLAQRFVYRMEHREHTPHVLRFLLERNWGNSRFLFEMSLNPEGRRLCRAVDLDFRKAYPDLLDRWVRDIAPEDSFPFVVAMTATMVGFPEDFESYAWRFRDPELKPSSVPQLIQPKRLGTDGTELFFEGSEAIEVPTLPLDCGFIHGRDEGTGLPTDVRDEPSEQFWGAFYWVQPTGLRSVVMGLGVADPLESCFGTAIWWDHTESRPFFGIMVVQDDTPEVRTRRRDHAIRGYCEMLRQYSRTKSEAQSNQDG